MSQKLNNETKKYILDKYSDLWNTMVKLGDFLETKRQNFSQFLLSHAKTDAQKDAAAQIARCPQSVFINKIITDLLPKRNDIPGLARQMLQSYNLNIDEFPAESVNKLHRYLQLFIESVAAI